MINNLTVGPHALPRDGKKPRGDQGGCLAKLFTFDEILQNDQYINFTYKYKVPPTDLDMSHYHMNLLRISSISYKNFATSKTYAVSGLRIEVIELLTDNNLLY